ncbi:hypothetical protein L3X38_027314 [Prunus dulcis]|uniref:Uncharacterized protein n=1 Tax=Prunus dulcis TaxID=3755 RepID=A0AAD4VMT7_PRUDU|nr:hypothetical protein L3X38_027314 [Prunus dulcis]
MRTVGFLEKIQSEPPGVDTWQVTVGGDVSVDVTTTSAHGSQIFLPLARVTVKKFELTCADVVVTSALTSPQLGLEPSRFSPLGLPGLVGPAACPGCFGCAGARLGLIGACCPGQTPALELLL